MLGGTLPTAVPPDSPQLMFGFTGPDIPGGDPLTPMLDITFASVAIPEPATVVLLFAGAAAVMRRRRHA